MEAKLCYVYSSIASAGMPAISPVLLGTQGPSTSDVHNFFIISEPLTPFVGISCNPSVLIVPKANQIFNPPFLSIRTSFMDGHLRYGRCRVRVRKLKMNCVNICLAGSGMYVVKASSCDILLPSSKSVQGDATTRQAPSLFQCRQCTRHFKVHTFDGILDHGLQLMNTSS